MDAKRIAKCVDDQFFSPWIVLPGGQIFQRLSCPVCVPILQVTNKGIGKGGDSFWNAFIPNLCPVAAPVDAAAREQARLAALERQAALLAASGGTRKLELPMPAPEPPVYADRRDYSPREPQMPAEGIMNVEQDPLYQAGGFKEVAEAQQQEQEKDRILAATIERQQRMMAEARGIKLDEIADAAEMEARMGTNMPSTSAADDYMASLKRNTQK
ncbi:hypothetical protein JKP88DRAFT_289942 [Tribonema minus]|uniref:Uncharacterized protein n=1 Tax=Tribonema minus TaxID=303371 RepID=A0A836CFD5_9STRA|nr:hypothetical protein JKP88DRAFT_289942 [Tribonema minus]